MSKRIQALLTLLKRCDEKLDQNGGFIMVVLLCVIVRFSWWAISSERPGDEIALVMVGVLTPIIGLLKYVLKHVKRK